MSYSETQQETTHSKPPLLIIVARGTKIRHLVLPPWIAVLSTIAFITITLLYTLATAYLAIRHDIPSAIAAYNAVRIQDYEDSFAELHAQLDKLNSEKLVDHHLFEQKLGELIERHDLLAQRQDRLTPLLGRATPPATSNSKQTVPKEIPIPTPRPQKAASLSTSEFQIRHNSAESNSTQSMSKPPTPERWALRSGSLSEPELNLAEHNAAITSENTNIALAGDPNGYMFFDNSLQTVEYSQDEQLDLMAIHAYMATEGIEQALDMAGITISDTENTGGPYIASLSETGFEERLRDLDEVLVRLDELKQIAIHIPIINPLPGSAKITSRFGSRKDPILNKPAYHSGVDYRARVGEQVRTTGAGKVVKAGWAGGYGRLIEIDHGHGISTRYGHLSAILVQEGDIVSSAALIGRAGSSGRSTGPHLHYEVRRNGIALDPLKFISAGKKIVSFL